MQRSISDKELAEGVLAGDSPSLQYLYDSTYGKIESFVMNNHGSVEEAKDVFQDAVLALYQNLSSGSYQIQKSTRLTSYLFQICKFQWYSALRSQHKKRKMDTIDLLEQGQYDRSFEDESISWESNRLLHKALDKLGDRCRNLLLAFYFEEKTMKQIADSLGQQTNSVKNAKYRCMQSLKDLIKTRPS